MSKLIRAFLPSIVFGSGAVIFGMLAVAGAFFDDRLTLVDALVVSIVVFLACVITPAIYFIPTAIAAFRDCRSYWGILIINIFPGLGHLVSLVWALVEQKPQPPIIQNFYQPPPPLQSAVEQNPRG